MEISRSSLSISAGLRPPAEGDLSNGAELQQIEELDKTKNSNDGIK